jgi:hypothetical protein
VRRLQQKARPQADFDADRAVHFGVAVDVFLAQAEGVRAGLEVLRAELVA